MSEIWYRVSRYSDEITATEWDRSTDEYLIKGSRREAKITRGYYHYPTWIEAKASMIGRIQSDISWKEREITALINRRSKFELMQEPSND